MVSEMRGDEGVSRVISIGPEVGWVPDIWDTWSEVGMVTGGRGGVGIGSWLCADAELTDCLLRNLCGSRAQEDMSVAGDVA